MKVPHRLPGAFIAVDHHPETAFGESLFPGDAAGNLVNVPGKAHVLFPQVKERGQMFQRDYQE